MWYSCGRTHSRNEGPFFPGQDLSHSCSGPPPQWKRRAAERRRNPDGPHLSPLPSAALSLLVSQAASFPWKHNLDYAGSRLLLTPVHWDSPTFLPRPTQPISAQPTSVLLNSTHPPNSTSFHPTHPNLALPNATELRLHSAASNPSPHNPTQLNPTKFHSRNIGSTQGHSAKLLSIQSNQTKFCSTNSPQHDITQSLYSTQTKLNTLNPAQFSPTKPTPTQLCSSCFAFPPSARY